MPNNNVLALPSNEAMKVIKSRARKYYHERELQRKRRENEVSPEVADKLERKAKIIRSLLSSGSKDHLFSGFGDDSSKWLKAIDKNPEEWVWVRAKYGVVGVPYPDGNEYSFPPNKPFPIKREILEYAQSTMNGELREV